MQKPRTRNKRLISFYQLMSGIDTTTWEVGKMIQNAKTSYDFAWPKFSARGKSDLIKINHLLSLRYKDGYLSEAAWAWKSSEDTTRKERRFLYSQLSLPYL